MTILAREEKLREKFEEKFKGWILQDDQEVYRSFEIIKDFWLSKRKEELEEIKKEMEKMRLLEVALSEESLMWKQRMNMNLDKALSIINKVL